MNPVETYPAKTLRDEYAIAALPQALNWHAMKVEKLSDAAKLAYSVADAMLAARGAKS